MNTELLTRDAAVATVRADRRAVDVVASTEAIDGHGTIVSSDWNLTRFLANPTVLYGHSQGELPIGHATNVRVERGRLLATLNFVTAAANPRAEQVWKLFQEGALRGVSVGFRPGSARCEMRGDREVTVLSGCELFEISVVAAPSNPEALATMRARALGGRDPVTPSAAPQVFARHNDAAAARVSTLRAADPALDYGAALSLASRQIADEGRAVAAARAARVAPMLVGRAHNALAHDVARGLMKADPAKYADTETELGGFSSGYGRALTDASRQLANTARAFVGGHHAR